MVFYRLRFRRRAHTVRNKKMPETFCNLQACLPGVETVFFLSCCSFDSWEDDACRIAHTPLDVPVVLGKAPQREERKKRSFLLSTYHRLSVKMIQDLLPSTRLDDPPNYSHDNFTPQLLQLYCVGDNVKSLLNQ